MIWLDFAFVKKKKDFSTSILNIGVWLQRFDLGCLPNKTVMLAA